MLHETFKLHVRAPARELFPAAMLIVLSAVISRLRPSHVQAASNHLHNPSSQRARTLHVHTRPPHMSALSQRRHMSRALDDIENVNCAQIILHRPHSNININLALHEDIRNDYEKLYWTTEIHNSPINAHGSFSRIGVHRRSSHSAVMTSTSVLWGWQRRVRHPCYPLS